jgi:outer membrane protein OmpA-like peptidoglycan-associated protein
MRRIIIAAGAAVLAGLMAASALADDIKMKIEVTNGGEPVGGRARYEVHKAGKHDSPTVGWATAGEELSLPAGQYDINVFFEDGAARKNVWLDGQSVGAGYAKTVEIGLPVASAVYHLTNGGEDAEGKARVDVHPAGKHDGPVITWAGSGGEMRLPEGKYDVDAVFEDGAARKEIWLDGEALSGKYEKSVEFSLPVASVVYHLTNGGEDAEGKARVEIHAAGKHDGPTITWAGSGGEMRLPEGKYDVHAFFEDGASHRELWLDGEVFAGKVEKTVEVGVKTASVVYHLTNGGVDAEGKARVEIHAAGKHDGPTITWAGSGGEMRLPEGKYDVHALFEDGAAHRELWLDGEVFAGKVEKTVEVGMKTADVTFHLLNEGEDAEAFSRVDLHAAGKHDGPTVSWAASGSAMRVPEGAYDVMANFRRGFVDKVVWLDGQAFAGKVDKTYDFKIKLAEPTVTATLNGADLGDKATITFIPAGKDASIGANPGGAASILEAGAYDLQATAPGAEGWLKNFAIDGKPAIVVPMKLLKAEVLKADAPAPKSCTIEVYGVNFDFNKSDLRPDSEPILKVLLKLFTDNPTFRAEIGGHTDNIGKPDYNLKLSEARAASVKAWLVKHGVASDRVTSRGYGDTRPLVDNDTEENRFKNRRVELKRQNCK